MPYIGSAVKSINTRSAIDHQQFLGSSADTVTNPGYYTFYVNYSPGNISVFVAGNNISHTDYTANNGTDVRISTSTLTINSTDNVEIIGYNVPTSQVLERSDVNITGGKISGIEPLAIADGGTGASTAAQAKLNLGVASPTPISWTRFYFDRGGSTPSGSIANSENVGKNFGSWTETTAANNGTTGITPSNATYDRTLSGITVNANGEFEFPAGVYEVHASIQYKIYNLTGILSKYDFYLYAESGASWAGSYDEQLLVPDTSMLVNNDMMIKISGIYVFENATQTNNILYLQMGTGTSPVNQNMFPDYGFLDIKKIG